MVQWWCWIEITFSSSEGTGVVYAETATGTGSATTTDNVIQSLATKINAESDFAFTAGVDSDVNLQLVANAVGAGIVTDTCIKNYAKMGSR